MEQAFAGGLGLSIPPLTPVNVTLKEMLTKPFEGQLCMLLALSGNGLKKIGGHCISPTLLTFSRCDWTMGGRLRWLPRLGKGL
jgi:hypothetical protein